MDRNIFSEEHSIFREAVRKWLEAEVKPHHEKWEKDGIVPRSIWRKAGEQGFLCMWMEPELGGQGVDFLYPVIVTEEIVRARAAGLTFGLHSDIVVPYIHQFGTDEQKKKWLPQCATGEWITAVAMTEPFAGSDLAAIRTTAIRDGNEYVINGTKTFITNGILADLVVVAVKTNPKADPPYTGVSLICVEADRKGFIKGKKLEKMGLRAQDTAELAFEDCRVPVSNLLGQEGQGFTYLMQKLQQERIVCSVGAQAAAEGVLEETIKYTQERVLFGKPLSKFQNTSFRLAELATEVEIGRVFVDRLITEHIKGTMIVKETSMAKWWVTDMAKRLTDSCLQFFGGYGYMLEYPIAKAYMDVRVQPIFAGANEVMKLIISKQMGL